MSRDQIEQGLPWRWNPERVRRALRDRNTNVAVAGEGRHLLGFGIMLYADEDAHLLLFAVDPAHRRQGIGAALLEWLETAARNFYGALGYHEQRIVRGMYSGVEDGITLEKWLVRDPV
jgi:ribosomal-protein-alanine N-acetyltransferase